MSRFPTESEHERQHDELLVFNHLEKRDIPDTPENRAKHLDAARDEETSNYG